MYVIDPSRTFRRFRLFAHTVRIYMILEYFLYILVCVENIQTSYEEMVVSKMKLAAGSIEKKSREKKTRGIHFFLKRGENK